MKKLKSLSIFFPALNDEKSIPLLIKKAYKIASRTASDFEIIIVNDGSTDDTIRVVKTLQKKLRGLKIISHKKNLGYGATLTTGFANAKYDWVFYTDGDGQYNPEELKKLVEKLDGKVTVVNGYKLERKDPWMRVFLGEIYNGFLQKIYRPPVTDVDCDFRLIKRSLLKKIKLTSKTGAICLELVVKLKLAGGEFEEVGVHHYPRLYGTSQFFRLPHLVNTLHENLRLLLDWLRYGKL